MASDIYYGKIEIRRTQVIVRNAEVEEGAGVAFNLYAAFVKLLGALDIPFLEFLGALLKTLHRLDFGRVGGRGMRRGRSSPAFREI